MDTAKETNPGRACLCWLISALWPRLLVSAVVASLVFQLSLLWSPAELLASAVSVLFEGGTDQMPREVKLALRETAIVKITASQYQEVYEATAPLNRCKLADDLGQLFGIPSLRFAAIDLDLSPFRVTRGADDLCQERLNHAIDNFAVSRGGKAGPGLILMQPDIAEGMPDELKKEIEQWIKNRIKSSVQFGHVTLNTRFGLVREFPTSSEAVPAFGLAVRARLLGEPIQPLPAVRSIAVRGHEALFRLGEAVPLHQLCTTRKDMTRDCPAFAAAIVGSGYSASDQHATLLGRVDGVDLHAAIAACPDVSHADFTHFLLDVILGLGLGWAYGSMWKRYFRAAAGPASQVGEVVTGGACRRLWRQLCRSLDPQRPQTAYLWFVLMALFSLAVIVVVGALSLLLFGGPCASGIFPVGIVVGMLIEATVLQGPETAVHMMARRGPGHSEHSSGTSAEAPQASRVRLVDRFREADGHGIFRTLLALMLIAWTVYRLIHH